MNPGESAAFLAEFSNGGECGCEEGGGEKAGLCRLETIAPPSLHDESGSEGGEEEEEGTKGSAPSVRWT